MTNLRKFFGDDRDWLEPFELLFHDIFDTNAVFAPAESSEMKYPVDIHDDLKSLNIEIAVAGIDKHDISIEEDGRILRVSYEKQEDKKDESKHYIQKKIAKRAFKFEWKISEKFDLKKIEATMDKGILNISIPKSEEHPIKKAIEIK